MKSKRRTRERPTLVVKGPKQVGETRMSNMRWGWVEPSIWTERMLTALEKGVKGGKWFSLVDKVYSGKNLRASWKKVRENKGAAGVDKQSVELFRRREDRYLRELECELRERCYKAKPVKRVWISKPGSKEKRPLGIPVIKDRIVQTAIRNVMEPIFEKEFAEQSYGFRPGRGCKDALRQVDGLLKNGNIWVVDLDIRSYFDSIPKTRLMKEVQEHISDGELLRLLDGYLNQRVMEGLREWETEKGTPQGAVISPLLANIYLNKIDQEMSIKGYEMVRYADDCVVLCREKEEAENALEMLRAMLSGRELELHPEKTRIVDAAKQPGFDFLGYHFERGKRWPRKKSMDKLKATIRKKTRRTSGSSMKCIVKDINQSVCGWFEYFKHSDKTTFGVLDSWIRMRLRSILRKRHGRKGRGRGADHQRWPNAYFASLGLFTLSTAHALVCQSR